MRGGGLFRPADRPRRRYYVYNDIIIYGFPDGLRKRRQEFLDVAHELRHVYIVSIRTGDNCTRWLVGVIFNGFFFSPFCLFSPIHRRWLGWRKTSRVPCNGWTKIVGWTAMVLLYSYYYIIFRDEFHIKFSRAHQSYMDRAESRFFSFLSGINNSLYR